MAEGNQNKILEEGDVQGQRNQEHPLLNSVVMDNVFSFMESTVTVKDLKNFRLVCKTWSDSSLKVWRKVAPLRLGPPERSIRTRSQSRGAQPPHGNYLPVNKYLKYMTTPEDPHQLQLKPFANLLLFGIDFSVIVPTCIRLSSVRGLGNRNLWTYLNNGQNHVKSFGFAACRFYEEDFARTFVKKLGFVRSVVLVNNPLISISRYLRFSHLNDVRELDISGYVPMDFVEMTTCAVNLEKLALRNNYNIRNCNLHNLVMGHNGFKECHPMKKLDVMESRFFINDQNDVNLLLDLWYVNRFRCRLELLTLTLETYHPLFGQYHFDNNNNSIEDLTFTFQPLMRLFSSTLKTVKVFRAPIHSVFPNEQQLFPEEMPTLEELHLYGNLVASFAFLEQTPNLKMLRIDRHCASMANHMEQLYFRGRMSRDQVTWFRERYRPHREDLLNGTGQEIRLRLQLAQMAELHLECNLNPETIQFLGNWMPNLKVFKGIMTDEIWKAVCEWMPHLEEVGILRRSQVGEEALTGCYDFGVGETDSVPREREPLSIVRFRNLRRFVYLAYCGQSSMGNLSVRRGFLEMPKLGMVYVCVSKELCAEAEAALKEAILNVTIIRNTNETCQGGWECCAESNFLNEFLNQD